MTGEIFISYARKDDKAARAALGAKGMVTALHDRLLESFDSLGSPQPTIFRDTKQIASNQQFEPRLDNAVRAAKVLVVVLSRNWLDSEWCKRELDTFVAQWRERGAIEQSIKERIFLVAKHAIPPAHWPPMLQGQEGCKLVEVDKESSEEIEFFDPDLGHIRNEQWFTRTRELARRLRNHVKSVAEPLGPSPKLDRVSAPAESGSTANPTTVYVARPASDMKHSYDTLVEELRGRGLRVVPDPEGSFSVHGEPMHGQQVTALIDDTLAGARLSIHLLGDKPGFQPEDAVPIVRLQLERAAMKLAPAAAEADGRYAFRRLIWAPRVLPGAHDAGEVRDIFGILARHSHLPPERRQEDALLQGDKLVGDTLTKFVQFVLQHIEDMTRPQTTVSLPAAAGAQVYIQHDEQDTGAAEAVAEGFVRMGFSPVLPIIEGDAAERVRIHRDTLKNADWVVLCWANAAPVWVRATASELRSWQSLGRDKAFATRIAVALPPRKVDKERLSKFPPRTDLDKVIDATAIASLDPLDLDPVLQCVGGR